jgi:hypothetical protein
MARLDLVVRPRTADQMFVVRRDPRSLARRELVLLSNPRHLLLLSEKADEAILRHRLAKVSFSAGCSG